MPKIASQYSSFVISKSYFIIRQKQKKKKQKKKTERETNSDRTSKFTMFVCLNHCALWHRDFVINESRHRSQKTDQRYWTKFKVYQIICILFRHFHNISLRSTIFFFFCIPVYFYPNSFRRKIRFLSTVSFLSTWKDELTRRLDCECLDYALYCISLKSKLTRFSEFLILCPTNSKSYIIKRL